MIRAEGLIKYYGSRQVIRDLSFSIGEREIVGFLGLNGAGKTTALKMLAGQLLPSAGRLELEGKDLLEDPLALRWKIGFLPESPPLYEEMTVLSFLKFAGRLRGYPENKLGKRVDEVIELTELGAYAHEPILTLSHGFKQRAGIAQAIVHEPALVILDEPINGLDPKQIVEMRKLIKSLKDEHTVLVSSHILPEISQTCDRILVIHDGRLVAEGTEADLGKNLTVGSKLRLEIMGEEAKIKSTFEGCDIVASFDLLESAPDGSLRVRAELDKPQPELLAKAVIDAGLGLRRFEPERSELEMMFIQLTQG